MRCKDLRQTCQKGLGLREFESARSIGVSFRAEEDGFRFF
jgi:hypothetical protein